MLNTKPIDTRHLKFRYSGTAEHYTYDRDTNTRIPGQTRDEATGCPLWKVRCVVSYKAAMEHGEITVVVPHPEPPTAEFESEVNFTDVTVKDWAINGNQGQTWHAETFTTDAPTTRKNQPTPIAA